MIKGFKKIVAYCYLKNLTVMAYPDTGDSYIIYKEPNYLSYPFPTPGIILIRGLEVCKDIIENRFFQVTVGDTGEPNFYIIKSLKAIREGVFISLSLKVIKLSLESLFKVVGNQDLLSPKFKPPIGGKELNKEQGMRFFSGKKKDQPIKTSTKTLPKKPADPITVWVEPEKKEELKNLKIQMKEM